MKLFGADSDHEAMNADDVLKRLSLGYHVSLRHSSIRPDLVNILRELHERDFRHYDHFSIQQMVLPLTFMRKA